MKTIIHMCVAIAVCSAVAAAGMLPPGNYAQNDESGEHTATSHLGGNLVMFDGIPFLWNGESYSNGLCELSFTEILPPDEEFGWVYSGPDGVDTGIVTRTH